MMSTLNSFVQAKPVRCIGCRTCMIACVVAHEGKKIFEVDPDVALKEFHPRLFMVKTAKLSAPIQCHQCENPACLRACAAGAISIVDNAVVIDEKKCIGCKSCVIACPFGAVEIVEKVKKVANKCDLCKDVADSPNCVKVCPTEALSLVTEETCDESLAQKRLAAVEGIAAASTAANSAA
jgi:electron transport protein HydN